MMDSVTCTDWNYNGCVSLPFEYDADEMSEIVERVGTQFRSELNQYSSMSIYGSLHKWSTSITAMASQYLSLSLEHGNEQKWFFLNGQLCEEQSIYVYPGSHEFVVVRYSGDNLISDSMHPDHIPIRLADGQLLRKTCKSKKLFSLQDIADLEDFVEGAISSEGQYVSWICKKGNLESDQYEYTISLHRLNQENGVIVPLWSASYKEPHTLRFSPDEHNLILVRTAWEGDWDEIVNIGTRDINEKILISGLHHAANLCWKPDGQGIFFVCDDDQSPEKYHALHFQSLPDRLPWWRRQKVIGQISFHGNGSEEPLLQRITTRMYDINHLQITLTTNELIYIEETRGALSEPCLTLHRLDLGTYSDQQISLPNAIITSIRPSRCGQFLAYVGSRVEGLNEVLVNVEKFCQEAAAGFTGYGVNIYDTRVFVLHFIDLTLKELNGNLSMQASIPIGTSRIQQELYWEDTQQLRYVATTGNHTSMVTTHTLDHFSEVVSPIGEGGVSKCHSFSEQGDCFCFYSEKGMPFVPVIYSTQRIFQRLASDEDREIKYLNEYNWHNLELMQMSDSVLDGWLYVPKKSHASMEKVPLVIYLYGGASPLTTAFDDLHQCLVTHGIAVAVMNPAGSAGYGSDYADLHKNDWGKRTVSEIAQTVENLIESYPIINREAIGVYGGSYGGFLTSLLIAQTDIFHAACTIGGISNITSYWGSSYFGYMYGLSALYRSYPWSHQEIFVHQSPLFVSHQIQTPLLMLHGEKDVSVPLAESEQLFTALKMQKKEASLIVFPEENHPIKSIPSSYFYVRRYIVAWFEKHLKKDSTLWDRIASKGIEQVDQ